MVIRGRATGQTADEGVRDGTTVEGERPDGRNRVTFGRRRTEGH